MHDIVMVRKKGKLEEKIDDFVIKIFGSFSNWLYEGLQDRWKKYIPYTPENNFFSPSVMYLTTVSGVVQSSKRIVYPTS